MIAERKLEVKMSAEQALGHSPAGDFPLFDERVADLSWLADGI